VAAGATGVEDALEELRYLPYEDIGFAKIDHHRALRDDLPEVVLGEGKTPEQVVAVARKLVEHSGRLLVTRIDGAWLFGSTFPTLCITRRRGRRP
jgi:pyridinium-3,5-biscarboxylic acid mononucleotide synthase